MDFRKSFLISFLSCLLFSSISIQSQNYKPAVNSLRNAFPYTCTVVPEFKTGNFTMSHKINNQNNNRNYSGYCKPERTDYPGVSSEAYFPVLVIFVQFKDDMGPAVDYWPVGAPPEYLNRVIAPIKKYNASGNWWDTYSSYNEGLSDYWMEQSRGKYHVIGKAYSIVLDFNWQHYLGIGGVTRVMDDVYEKLKTLNINWPDYDKWCYSPDPEERFYYAADGYVDMIYMTFRSRPPQLGFTGGGIAELGYSYSQGVNYKIDEVNNILINGTFGRLGSGILMTPGYYGIDGDSTYGTYIPLTEWGMKSFSEHEFGHYIFGGGHGNYGKMSGSDSPYGADECLSPFEAAYLNYNVPQLVDFKYPAYELNDFSSRSSNLNGEILQVPITTENEFFLIANRRKISDYDRIMWGDTARGNPYRNINPEYGKGVYIYHIFNGYSFPSKVDQECADGLYNWSFNGYLHPDWSDEQLVEYYIRMSVAYGNDNSTGSYSNTDGKSIFTWFGPGKKEAYLGGDGIDKVFTNTLGVWTSREWQGDRWDAWNVGYNEIFSPYSSPSTVSWLTEGKGPGTGIYIWYYADIGGIANFKIYREDIEHSRDEILQLTPPSRPMGARVTFTSCENNLVYPRVVWLHNMEPDMKSPPNTPMYDFKAYKIFRAVSRDEVTLPVDYQLVMKVYIKDNEDPEFTDKDMELPCTLTDKTINVRYMVSAEDMYGTESVKSDFAGFSLIQQQLSVDNFNEKGNPFKYSLSQNYPNPFNPETNISYTLAQDGQVVIKIYNVLGEEVSVLINEIEKKGEHTIKYNASSLPSGVYFYQVQTAFFSETKKMVLVK